MSNPRKIDAAKLAAAVAFAQKTSVQNAERAHGISCSTIRNEMKRLGIARRRVGNFTLKDLDGMAGLIAE